MKKNYILIPCYNTAGAFYRYAPVARNLGLKTVCLKNKYYNDDKAKNLCDDVIIGDPEDVLDPERAFNYLSSKFDIQQIAGIILHDVYAYTYIHFCEKLNIKTCLSKWAVLSSVIKPAMRAALNNKTNYPVSYRLLHEVCDLDGFDGYPAHIKPAQGSASEWCKKVGSVEDAKNFLKQAMQERGRSTFNKRQVTIDGVTYDLGVDFIIEEFLDGEELSVEGYVYNKKPTILAIHEMITYGGGLGDFQSEAISPPIRLSKEQVADVETCVCESLKAIGYDNHVFHIEVKFTSKGPRIVEINPRNGGAAGTDRTFLQTGVCLKKACVEMAIGKWVPPKKIVKKPYVHVDVIYPFNNGTVRSIRGIEELKEIPEVKVVKLFYNVGDVINNAKREVYLAEVICQHSDYNKLLQLSPIIKSTLRYEIS